MRRERVSAENLLERKSAIHAQHQHPLRLTEQTLKAPRTNMTTLRTFRVGATSFDEGN
jgi:hypothetical protein